MALPILLGAAALLMLARKRQSISGSKLALRPADVHAEADRMRQRGDAQSADAIDESLAVMLRSTIERANVLMDPIAIPADEQPGGDHYGGNDPFDYEHYIVCMVCAREGKAYVRDANYRAHGTDHRVEWLRFDPGWTAQMPVNDAQAKYGYRCPDHQFPRPGALPPMGPPVPPHQRVQPGFYWYWVKPGPETIAWGVMLRRWGKPAYVLKSIKSWEDILLGSIELFEVNGQEMIWAMPSPLSRPKPAPKGAATTLFDILAAGIEG